MRLVIAASFVVAAALTIAGDVGPARRPGPRGLPALQQDTVEAAVLRGRIAVLSHACGDCHGGVGPARDGWLTGIADSVSPFNVGPFKVWSRNLTPDSATGTGRYTERQIFNALRYGLKPSVTPDVEITSETPGQGNHPANPSYLAPSMPWYVWRKMPDRELRDIAAYLKRGVKPVAHAIPASEGPPDNWASEYTIDKIGPRVPTAFPTSNEVMPQVSEEIMKKVLRGRDMVVQHGCADCHGASLQPSFDGWLVGARKPEDVNQIGPFITRARNLTPDNATGMGRFTERQVFNALRYGLRPGETPDVDITSTTPGQGNHPENGKYLAPPMPWPSWRHMPDADLWAIAAYLKHGVKPVANRVADSEGPPDFWASEYTPDKIGAFPAPPFPTANERRVK